MFLAWVILNNLEGQLLKDETRESLEAVRQRKMTGREFLFKECDEKLIDDDLNEEGNAFAKHYYEGEKNKPGAYVLDYSKTLGNRLPSLYYVEDTWQNYDKLAVVINRRFQDWKNPSSGSGWKFWKR